MDTFLDILFYRYFLARHHGMAIPIEMGCFVDVVVRGALHPERGNGQFLGEI